MVLTYKLPKALSALFNGAVVQTYITEDVLKVYPELPGQYPIVYWPAHGDAMLMPWLMQHHESVEEDLLMYGAALFKGFQDVDTPSAFQQAFSMVCGEPLTYQFRTSPRSEVGNNIYTSTDHPADQVIHMHTECSYSPSWPRNIAFYCQTPSPQGGETPVADERKVIAHLPGALKDKFEDLGILYVRNFSKGLGLPWQQVFQTEDKQAVEQFLNKENMRFEWRPGDVLRMEWALPAFRKHPVTRERLWFNHMFFGHKMLYDRKVLKVVPESHLPFLTYYGDGSPIEDEVIGAMQEGYAMHKVVFPWEKNDFIILDNMKFSHGRNPYQGDRKIIVAMGNEVNGITA